MNKLAAIYNVWDGSELLIGSMRTVANSVDLFIIVHQDESNFGELYNPLDDLPVSEMDAEFNIQWVYYQPSGSGMIDERLKRNLGLNVAKEFGCTHFIHMDCDEYYFPGDFNKAYNIYLDWEEREGIEGSVLGLDTYFKSPELKQEEREPYHVPFVHRLKDDIRMGVTGYPFRVDPTRSVNVSKVMLITEVFMQHYSWVRADIIRKAKNSSAHRNIKKANLLEDYWVNAKEGSIVNGGFKLIKVPDYFGINEMIT